MSRTRGRLPARPSGFFPGELSFRLRMLFFRRSSSCSPSLWQFGYTSFRRRGWQGLVGVRKVAESRCSKCWRMFVPRKTNLLLKKNCSSSSRGSCLARDSPRWWYLATYFLTSLQLSFLGTSISALKQRVEVARTYRFCDVQSWFLVIIFILWLQVTFCSGFRRFSLDCACFLGDSSRLRERCPDLLTPLPTPFDSLRAAFPIPTLSRQNWSVGSSSPSSAESESSCYQSPQFCQAGSPPTCSSRKRTSYSSSSSFKSMSTNQSEAVFHSPRGSQVLGLRLATRTLRLPMLGLSLASLESLGCSQGLESSRLQRCDTRNRIDSSFFTSRSLQAQMEEAMARPIYSQRRGVNWQLTLACWSKQLSSEDSMVQQLGTCSLRWTTALAVLLLCSGIWQLQEWKRNMGVYSESSLRSTLQRWWLRSKMGQSGPNAKTPRRAEWPCRSMKASRREPQTSLQFFTNYLMACTSGFRILFKLQNSRLRSRPDTPVRELPRMTPSGFSIGTTLNTTRSRSRTASFESPHSQSSRPCATKLLFDYPGCTLAVMTTQCLFGAPSNLPTVKRGTWTPERLKQSLLTCSTVPRGPSFRLFSRVAISLSIRLQEYGTQKANWASSLSQNWCQNCSRAPIEFGLGIKRQLAEVCLHWGSFLVEMQGRIPCWQSDLALPKLTIANRALTLRLQLTLKLK